MTEQNFNLLVIIFTLIGLGFINIYFFRVAKRLKINPVNYCLGTDLVGVIVLTIWVMMFSHQYYLNFVY